MGRRVGTPTGRLCAIQGGSAQCYGEDGSFGREVLSCMRTAGAISGREASTGLWRWKPGPPKLYPMPDPAARSDRRRQRRTPDLHARRNQTAC